MDWNDSQAYQQLVEACPELRSAAQEEAFRRFVREMWEPPTTYRGWLQAYLEFTTPEQPQFRRLNAERKPERRSPPASERPASERPASERPAQTNRRSESRAQGGQEPPRRRRPRRRRRRNPQSAAQS